MKKGNELLSPIFTHQREIAKLVLISVLVALGVNLITNGLINIFNIQNSTFFLLLTGLLLSIGIIFLMFINDLRSLDKKLSIYGFFIYDPETKDILAIPRYSIVEDMNKFLSHAFSENKALETIWKSKPIEMFNFTVDKNNEKLAKLNDSSAIIIELLEYCIIEKLSTHLSDFFNHDQKNLPLKTLERKDIPEILLNNRFLKLFSEDMNNREAFVKEMNKGVHGKIVMAYSNGAYYQNFDLVLPKDSKVRRNDKNGIIIDTNIFTLSITLYFAGFNTFIEPSFFENYLGITQPPLSFSNYQFEIDVDVKFKMRSIFLPIKHKYYIWADSFIEKLNEYASKDEYFRKINWETVKTIILYEKNAGTVTAHVQ